MANVNLGKRLANKVAVITASTDGIGLAIAQRFAAEGAKVVISSRKPENVNRAVADLKSKGFADVIGVKCHVAQPDDRKQLLEAALKNYGTIDILVSNAAVNPAYGSILDCPEDAWDKIFDVNVKAAFMLAKETAPILLEKSSGNIIFVSSVAGLNPFPMLGAYSVSKTALLGLTKALSNELSVHNVRVNCIAPGIIKTRFSQVMYDSEASKEICLGLMTSRRFGEPDEIAGVAAFLASDDASYVTGETLTASGGMLARL